LLNKSSSRRETQNILFKAVIELDKYNLLAGLTVRQAYKLVLGKYRISKFNILNYKNNINNPTPNSVLENNNCLVAAHITHTEPVYPNGLPLLFIWDSLYPYMLKMLENFDNYSQQLQNFIKLLGAIYVYSAFSWMTFILFFPFALSKIDIGFGVYIYYNDGYIFFVKWIPSKGWIWTQGTNGVAYYQGEMFGNIDTVNGIYGDVYIGVEDFLGLRIWRLRFFRRAFYIGYASHVNMRAE
jgi:hypothetical protein